MDKSTSKIIALALIVLSLVALYIIRVANRIPIIPRVVVALAMLVVVGAIIQKLMSYKGGYGFYMLGSQKGLAAIDNVSKNHAVFWDVMAMWGLTLGFGLLTYPLMKGKIDKRVYAFGMISLVLIMLFVLPNLGTALQFINLPQIQSAVASRSTVSASSGIPILTYVVYAVTILAGFSGTLFLSLFISTESILWSIIQYATAPSASGATTITNQIGVAPIIPGIDIPFLAGISALVILLTIHEFSHGVLARRAKVKLKEIGILMFGSIPVGGYVEPDEKMVDKLDNIKQTKIFSAGVAANFIAMIVFFLLMIAMMNYVLPGVYSYKVVVTGTLAGYPANGVLKNGMQIIKWNNITINNITALDTAGALDRPGANVTILTNTGTYTMKAISDPTNSSRGLLGVSLGYAYLPINPSFYSSLIFFLYTFFALSMLLNFFVGALNLLPLPGLDGWRIYYANIKNEKFIKFLGALIIILIILNILPIVFYL